MAYTPTEWQTGDVIDAEKLNHAEEGIAAAGQVVILHEDPETHALDKTWKEIDDGLAAGVIFLHSFHGRDPGSPDAVNTILRILDGTQKIDDEDYWYVLMAWNYFAIASAEDDYPVVLND